MPSWYCCILDTERSAINALCFNLVLLPGRPLPLDSWLIIWAAASWGASERRAAAEAAWQIEYTEIIVPDEPPIPAVQVTDLVAWGALALEVVAPGPKCPDGCTQPGWA